MKAIARVSLVAFSVLLFGSCLDVETQIDLHADHSGRVRLTYEIDNELWDLGVFDPESSVRAIPVTEADFRRTERRIRGVELREYSRSRGETTTEIEAVLGFENLEALNGIYAPGRSLISVTEEEGERIYRQVLRPDSGKDAIDEEFLETFLDDHRISFLLRVPSEVRETSHGEVVDSGREIRLSLDIVEFLSGSDPRTWEVRY